MYTSEAITRGVRVLVTSQHDPARSNPAEGQWFFLYTVTLTNDGDETVQLLSRHWIITDGEGREQEVRGPGVIGEKPVLAPGESYEYTSGCPLPTPFGTMHGSYRMRTEKGDAFDAEIAPFGLGEPYAVH